MAKILIVDDHPTNRDYLVTLLHYQGHELTEAPDGMEGLKFVRAERPDLVIADILMPVMDGYEFVREIRADSTIASTRVVFYTAHYLEREARALADSCGVARVLTKPAPPEQILKTVCEELAAAGSEEELPCEPNERSQPQSTPEGAARSRDELRNAALQFQALLEASRHLSGEHEPQKLVEGYCDAARRIVGARYGAVAILDNQEHCPVHFAHAGFYADPQSVAKSLEFTGELEAALRERRTVRISRDACDRRTWGFPPLFPAFRSMLLTPVASAQICGWLCLGDKVGFNEFTADDEEIAVTVSAQFAVSFENALSIDRQRKSQIELEKALEQRQMALDAAALGTWEYDAKTGDLSWDECCSGMFGLAAEERISYAEALRLIHEDDRPRIHAAVQLAMAGVNEGAYNQDFRVVRPDGSVCWVAFRGRAYCDSEDWQGPISRFAGVSIDITERKRAELEIKRLNTELEKRVMERTAELQASNKELEAFAYSVSHDLRAPLRGIDGWSLALLEDYNGQLDERGHEYLHRVRGEAERMGLLIDDLLELSRITRASMEQRAVDLSELGERVAARVREAESGRRLEFQIPLGLTATGDVRLLEVALTNLFSNAAKFTGHREEARIEFGRQEGGGNPVFYVRDNGVGFDMAYAGKLFGAFQRLHKTSEFPGTGVGLATVQRIIHRHGGRIWADAKPGLGATFYFTLGAAA